MLIKDKLRKEITPKRVFSVLKLVKLYNGKIKKEDVYNLIQPLRIVDKQDDVKKVLNFSINENFIKENIDGKLEVVIDKNILNSIKSFRSFCSENIFNNMESESLFFKITSEILSKDLSFYKITGFEDISNYLENKEVDKEFILAWRFWAEFLQFGKILNNQFLINPYGRIMERIINNTQYDEGNYKINKFISIIKEECPEFKSVIYNNEIGLSLTVALRTLEVLGAIKIKKIEDSTEVWRLYYSSIDKLEVTDIEISRERSNG